MKISLRSLLSVLAAGSLAAVGAANSAEAWFQQVSAGAATTIITAFPTAASPTSVGSGANRQLWTAAGAYRPNVTPGRDQMYVAALGGTANGGWAVPRAAWTCASSVRSATGAILNVTFPSIGTPTTAGQTAFTPDTNSQAQGQTYPRRATTAFFRVECN